MTDKLIGYLVGAGCITVLGWTLRQSRPGPHWGWRAARRPYVYKVRGRKRG